MHIRTWSQNPSLKESLDTVLENVPPIKATQNWRIFLTSVEKQPSLILEWRRSQHRGALSPEALESLLQAFLEALESPLSSPPEAIFLILASAGADVEAPFESLLAIHHMIETLSRISQEQNIPITGVICGPLGAYGGASLLLASLCQIIWCDRLEDLHLLARD